MSPAALYRTFWRESWDAGETATFEYHCFEDDTSSDATLWYHSHQEVTVLGHDASDHSCLRPDSFEVRSDAGQPCGYRVRFADGWTWTVFEDELLVSAAGYCRLDPPKPPAER